MSLVLENKKHQINLGGSTQGNLSNKSKKEGRKESHIIQQIVAEYFSNGK
jgi:hypothetical protein